MADVGLGVKLFYSNAAIEQDEYGEWTIGSPTWVKVKKIVDLKAGKTALSTPKIKTTTHDAVGDHTFIPGPLSETDDFEVTVQYDTDQHDALDLIRNSPRAWKYEKRDGSTGIFAGWVVSQQPSDPMEDVSTDVVVIAVGSGIDWDSAE